MSAGYYNSMNHTDTIQAAVAENKLSKAAVANITQWLKEEKYREYHTELQALIERQDWKTLEDSFFQVIPFGTGGRRGTVGVGSNRINKITIGESAQGLCDYAATQGEAVKQQGIVIAYDTRTTSEEFAQYTARICAANGFKTYLFDGFRTTPQLSFAVRHLGTAAGIVISASHNPPSDNGFKAYWSDGGQVVPPHDKGIMDHVATVQSINITDFDQAVDSGNIIVVGKDVDDAYISAIVKQSVTPGRSVHIVYSPLHGTGIRSVIPTLEHAGFTQVSVVKSQTTPDGTFPTVEGQVPNPEVQAANNLAVAQAKNEGADLAITTDPDADRLGVIVRDTKGEYQFLTGNKIATLICHHVLHNLHEQNKLKSNQFVVKTIVTTDAIDALAKQYGVTSYNNILIGFKYVAELIALKQDQGKEEFLFGGEESHGILQGSYTRDKDAAVAALLIAELASNLKDQGETLVDQLYDIYRQHGLYFEDLASKYYHGASGFEQMNAIMESLRNNPPQELAGQRVVRMIDRKTGQEIDPATKKNIGHNDGTPGNVLIFWLSEDGRSRVTIRPSGTEPKIKAYVQLHIPVAAATNEELVQQEKEAAARAQELAALLL